MKRGSFDRPFLVITGMLVVMGFFIFSSASLGLLARDGAQFSNVAFSQLVLGIFMGGVSLVVFVNTNYRALKRFALPLFIAATVITLLVFIPGLGFEYGGATRWISLGALSFQPAEFLKLGFVVYLAAWLSRTRARLSKPMHGIIPLIILLAITGGILLAQPDTGTLMVIVAAALGMYVAAGARWRDIVVLGGLGVAAMGILAYLRPYVKDRLVAFFDPSVDPLGVSYQIQQSLIAVGSGELFGRGFGQSVQKFDYLPEPIGDSIFAVAAEEFGFVGALVLISLFLALAFRGFRIAARAPDYFGGLVVVGLVILIVAQSFINIASMVGVLPLTGLPLLFVSHGGSALLFALLEIGIILNISRYAKR